MTSEPISDIEPADELALLLPRCVSCEVSWFLLLLRVVVGERATSITVGRFKYLIAWSFALSCYVVVGLSTQS